MRHFPQGSIRATEFGSDSLSTDVVLLLFRMNEEIEMLKKANQALSMAVLRFNTNMNHWLGNEPKDLDALETRTGPELGKQIIESYKMCS